MSDQVRTWLAVITLAVYTGLLTVKVIRIRRTLNPAEKRQLRFEFVRQGLDCSLLLCFLLSGTCPDWFALFGTSALGYCTGCYILVTVTLLVSVFVDWIPVHREKDRRGLAKPTFPEFLLKQLVNILRITFVLTLVWCVFLAMEETGLGPVISIMLAVAMLLLLRVGLLLARKNKKKAS